MRLIQNLKWRYATKQFDATKTVSQSNIEKMKEAIQLSASSYGIQPYKILIVRDKELKKKLKPASWNQSQITDASHLFVFCNYFQVSDNLVDEFIKLKSEKQNIAIENLKGYGDFIKEKIAEKSTNERSYWAAKQTYIALSNLIIACAELKIDTCPMEGFEPQKYNEILELSEKGLSASVIVAIGYRSSGDKTQYQNKVRKSIISLFETR